MTEEYIEKINNIEREVALTNQFNLKVVEPFMSDIKNLLKEQPNRKEFDGLASAIETAQKEIDDIKEREKSYVTTTKFYSWIVGIGSVTGVILTIWLFIEKIRGA